MKKKVIVVGILIAIAAVVIAALLSSPTQKDCPLTQIWGIGRDSSGGVYLNTPKGGYKWDWVDTWSKVEILPEEVLFSSGSISVTHNGETSMFTLDEGVGGVWVGSHYTRLCSS